MSADEPSDVLSANGDVPVSTPPPQPTSTVHPTATSSSTTASPSSPISSSKPSTVPTLDWSGFEAHLNPPPTDWRLVHGNRDIYYRRAKETGYRARSAYKLLQVHQLHTLFTPTTQRVVDLCAAPGSWSQVAVELMPPPPPSDASSTTAPNSKPRVIAVDLQEMAPIPGVHILQGDVTSATTVHTILAYFAQQPVDLILCDGAPDVTGVHTLDEHMQSQLLLPVLHITTHMLRIGGTMCAKIFKDAGYGWLESQLRVFFEYVECVKPTSSRIRSAEHFVVCKGFRLPAGYVLRPMQSAATETETETEGGGGGEESDEMRLTEAIDAYLRCGDYNPHQRLRVATTQPATSTPQPDQYTQLVSQLLSAYT